MRWAIAAIISAVLFFQWGFLFYALYGVPEPMISEVKDDVAAGKDLKQHFPENGVYFIPNATHDEEKRAELHQAGPVAIVHMLKVNGSNMMDPGMLISGFCHMLLTCIFLCMLLGLVNQSLPGWFARVGFFVFVGFVLAFYSRVGGAIWWHLSFPWQLINALYDWVGISLAGIVIATIAPYPKKEKLGSSN